MPRDPIAVEGRQFASLRQAASHYGVDAHNAGSRLRRGWTIEQALELSPPPRSRPVTVRGEIFFSLSAAAVRYGVIPVTASWRYGHGWTIEQALDLAPPPDTDNFGNSHPVTVQGLPFPSFRAACRHFGVSYSTAVQRRTKGLSVEKSLGLEAPDPVRGTEVRVAGLVFRSIAAARRHFGVGRATAAYRLRQGWTIEQAMGLERRTTESQATLCAGSVIT